MSQACDSLILTPSVRFSGGFSARTQMASFTPRSNHRVSLSIILTSSKAILCPLLAFRWSKTAETLDPEVCCCNLLRSGCDQNSSSQIVVIFNIWWRHIREITGVKVYNIRTQLKSVGSTRNVGLLRKTQVWLTRFISNSCYQHRWMRVSIHYHNFQLNFGLIFKWSEMKWNEIKCITLYCQNIRTSVKANFEYYYEKVSKPSYYLVDVFCLDVRFERQGNLTVSTYS